MPFWRRARTPRRGTALPPLRHPGVWTFETIRAPPAWVQQGRNPQPSAGIIDLQSVMTASQPRAKRNAQARQEAIDKKFFYVKTDFRHEGRRLPGPDRAG